MKTADVTKTLEVLGWETHTDEVGDKFTHFYLPDRTIQIIYGVRKFSNAQQLEAMLSLSTDAFSKACSEISGDGAGYTPLIRAWKGIRMKVPEVLEEHVRQVSSESIQWAKGQDLEAGLKTNASLPTDAPGARAVWHLGALAVLGDIARLRSYQISFEAGDRLGFVNYVTRGYIDRAVGLAQHFSCN
ncbi:hypothetical protein [uncultured Ruegeria sp.]|uniref:DUF6990 domain-containing protein n=1 Tax=uncultured Ruegeria sp. TaxID=259304 RepID=UPI00260803F2|nr:hypothetical protein [uncultured Ruegeria sp.]